MESKPSWIYFFSASGDMGQKYIAFVRSLRAFTQFFLAHLNSLKVRSNEIYFLAFDLPGLSVELHTFLPGIL